MKYRKKPVVIDAIQWTGDEDRYQECITFLGEDFAGFSTADPAGWVILIDTLEGRMECPVGHWIIRGVKGEHYSCAPDAFAATYEPVDR